jgi:nucleotide-binding universal stress UspA family protein
LIVVHVTETIQPVESEIGKKETRADEAYEKQVQKQAEDMVADLVEHRLGDQVLVRADVAVGEAAREIVRTAEKEQADLIVISTRGRTGWGRLVFGSVAEKVVRTAHCPTLTVRAPEGEKPRTSRPT